MVLQPFSSFRGKTQCPIIHTPSFSRCLKFLGSRFYFNSLAQINAIYIYSTEVKMRCTLSFVEDCRLIRNIDLHDHISLDQQLAENPRIISAPGFTEYKQKCYLFF